MEHNNKPNIVNIIDIENSVRQLWTKLSSKKKELNEDRDKIYSISITVGGDLANESIRNLKNHEDIVNFIYSDVVARFKQMSGCRVSRQIGFYTQASIAPKISTNSKQYLEQNGQQVVDESTKNNESYVEKLAGAFNCLGFDRKYPEYYYPCDYQYMESSWNIFSQLFQKGLIYNSSKITPYSVEDQQPTSFVENVQRYYGLLVTQFALASTDHYLLVSACAWTLPVTTALCVSKNLIYVSVLDKKNGRKYILAEKVVESVFRRSNPLPEYEIIDRFTAERLVGQQFVPIFDYLRTTTECPKNVEFLIYYDEFELEDDYLNSTGVKCLTPSHNEDHYISYMNLTNDEVFVDPMHLPSILDDQLRFKSLRELPHIKGMTFNDGIDHIIRYLQSENMVFCEGERFALDLELIVCRPMNGWYFRTSAIHDQIVTNWHNINWIQNDVADRAKRTIKNYAQKDLLINRNDNDNGVPIPIWISDDGEEITVISSIEELEARSGVKNIANLPRRQIDDITIPSSAGKGLLRRICSTFNTNFAKGCFSLAKHHWPFNNQVIVAKEFPFDFTAIGLFDFFPQLYVDLAFSTALFDQPLYRTIVSTGYFENPRHVAAQNIYDVIQSNSSDACRLLVMSMDQTNIKHTTFRAPMKRTSDHLTDFIQMHSTVEKNMKKIDGFKYEPSVTCQSYAEKWIQSLTQNFIKQSETSYETYNLWKITPMFIDLVRDIQQRFVRRAVLGTYGSERQRTMINLLLTFYINTVKVMAPIIPFTTEYIWQQIRRFVPPEEQNESVHECKFPTADPSLIDEKLLLNMRIILSIKQKVWHIRTQQKIDVKQWLTKLTIINKNLDPEIIKEFEEFIVQSTKCKRIEILADISKEHHLTLEASPHYQNIGKKFKSNFPIVKKVIEMLKQDKIGQLIEQGTISVDGFEVDSQDVILSYTYTGEDSSRYSLAYIEYEGKEKKPIDDELILLDLHLWKETDPSSE